MTADIVCRICGAEEGVFRVLRSESGTSYECHGCLRPRGDEWWRCIFTEAAAGVKVTPTHPVAPPPTLPRPTGEEPAPLGAGEEIITPPAPPT